jgi:ATP/maltotriose-dependent transcriptional regulator MalT
MEPQPGLALLRLAQGDVDRAAAAIGRALDEATTPLPRAALLPAYIEIALAGGDLDGADAACSDLQEIARVRGSDALTAMSAHAAGAVALGRNEPRAALAPLRAAFEAWQKLEAPYEAARTRELVGLACRALGDEETAALELDAAHAIFVQLGAAPDLSRADSLVTGGGNHAIAVELVVSDHTVRRHLQNIFSKLGVSSRTAATAYAFQHDLV